MCYSRFRNRSLLYATWTQKTPRRCTRWNPFSRAYTPTGGVYCRRCAWCARFIWTLRNPNGITCCRVVWPITASDWDLWTMFCPKNSRKPRRPSVCRTVRITNVIWLSCCTTSATRAIIHRTRSGRSNWLSR